MRITNANIILPDRCVKGSIVISDGKIAAIDTSAAGSSENQPESYSAEGCYVAPGFVDLHIHGFAGHDLSLDSNIENVGLMEAVLLEYGTTSYLATLGYKDLEVASLVNYLDELKNGAQMLGLYLEGPFINPRRMGAIHTKYCLQPSVDDLKRILDETRGYLRIMTVAPELEQNLAIIEHLAEQGVVPALGHTLCTYDQAMEGIRAGIRHTTHLFNAMTGLSHREPGAAGAVLTTPGMTAELIADGIHIHPVAMQLAFAVKGAEHTAVVTDATPPAGGSKIESLMLLGNHVEIREGAPRMIDGTLAGSVLTLDKALRNLVNVVGVSLHDAVRMITLTPATIIGCEKTLGSLEPGKKANLVVLDARLNVRATFLEGKLAWDRSGVGTAAT